MLIRLFQQTTRCRVPTTRPTIAGWALLKRPYEHERSNTMKGNCDGLLLAADFALIHVQTTA